MGSSGRIICDLADLVRDRGGGEWGGVSGGGGAGPHISDKG